MAFKEKLVHMRMHYQYKNKYIKNALNYSIFNSLIEERKDADIDIVSVAFNNPKMIDYQIKLVKKYIKDNFYLIIADNSSDEKAANSIKKICIEENVPYIKLPANPYNGKFAMGSYSNGAAMNFLYKYFIQQRKSQYFGFIDHDIFPYKEVFLVEKLRNQAFWGTLRTVPTKNNYCCLYPWAGFCFFDKKRFKDNEMNFMPQKGFGDTGASNYLNCYLQIIRTDEYLEYCFANLRRIQIEGAEGSPQASQYECIDESWIHYLNASNWSNEKIDVKEKKMKELIDRYLK